MTARPHPNMSGWPSNTKLSFVSNPNTGPNWFIGIDFTFSWKSFENLIAIITLWRGAKSGILSPFPCHHKLRLFNNMLSFHFTNSSCQRKIGLASSALPTLLYPPTLTGKTPLSAKWRSESIQQGAFSGRRGLLHSSKEPPCFIVAFTKCPSPSLRTGPSFHSLTLFVSRLILK